MEDAVYQILGVALGYLLAQIARRLQRSRFWRTVEANAERFLKDPKVPVDDAKEAVQLALVEAQRQQLSEVERHIEQKSAR